jgi:hypothetical protein
VLVTGGGAGWTDTEVSVTVCRGGASCVETMVVVMLVLTVAVFVLTEVTVCGGDTEVVVKFSAIVKVSVSVVSK